MRLVLGVRDLIAFDSRNWFWDNLFVDHNGGNGNSFSCIYFLVLIFVLVGVLLEVSENIVEHEVTIWLLGEKKCLSKLSPWLAVVRHLADSLDYNTIIRRSLRVY